MLCLQQNHRLAVQRCFSTLDYSSVAGAVTHLGDLLDSPKRVAQAYLKPENLVTLIVGNAADIQPPLTEIAAEVTPIDITIPAPKSVARNICENSPCSPRIPD